VPKSAWGEEGGFRGWGGDDLELRLLVQQLKLSCSIGDLATLLMRAVHQHA